MARVRRAYAAAAVVLLCGAAGPALAVARADATRDLFVLHGSKTASVVVKVNRAFSPAGIRVSGTAAYAGYELSDLHNKLISWMLQVKDASATFAEGPAAPIPAGKYRLTLLTSGNVTITVRADTSATKQTLSPRTAAPFTFATASSSATPAAIARANFHVPTKFALAVHIAAISRDTDIAGYTAECVTVSNLCETDGNADHGAVEPAPGGPGSTDQVIDQFDYKPGSLPPGTVNAIVECASASATLSVFSAMVVLY